MFKYAKEHNMFMLGNADAEFISTLDIRSGDTVINKTATSPFRSKNLKASLVSQGIERLIFSGVSTDNAINIGTREAHDMGYYTIIAEDACGASSDDFHSWSLTLLKKIANEILSTDEILEKINR